MSHFVLAVISVDPDPDLDLILEPYYEGYAVEPYIYKTKRQLIKDARERYKTSYNNYIENLKKLTDKLTEKEINYYEYELPKLLYSADSEIYEEVKKEYDDEEFDDDGNLISTYNKNAKWDWYMIGGRWAGLIRLKGSNKKVNQAKIKDINFEPDIKDYERELEFWDNYVEGKNPSSYIFEFYKPDDYKEKYKTKEKYAKLATSFTTNAVVTPDGIWYEKGKMLAFGITVDEDSEWEDSYKSKFIDGNEDLYMTILDCHI